MSAVGRVVHQAYAELGYLAVHIRMSYATNGRNHAACPASRLLPLTVSPQRARLHRGLDHGRQNERKTVTVTITAGNSTDFPVYDGTVGPHVIDIRKLYGETGMFTYDPGFTSTAAANRRSPTSTATKAVLLYRGYPIEQLAENSDFLEVCYLLLYGELPTPQQKADFDHTHHPPHDGARAVGPVLLGLPPRRAPDGGHVRRASARSRPSITTRPTSPIRSSA